MKYEFKDYKKSKILSGHLKMGGKSPNGEEICANNIYFLRGGKPWIGVMGEYHSVRDSRENWYDVMCKMKAGGVGVVATYIFWNYIEEEEGKFDFSGDRDLRFFVKEAERAGLDVFLRIGPWAHAEARHGGFPDWLLKKPFKLRDTNPGYMEKVEILYTKLYEQVKGLFYEDGGNIIGIQFENELADNAQHLLDLKNLALKIGFKAPLYTVTGWDGGPGGAKIPLDEVIPVFGAYPEEPWAGHTNRLPVSQNYIFSKQRECDAVGRDIFGAVGKDGWRIPLERYPFATCELGGGNQITHMRRPIIKPMDVYAMSLVKLGSGNNLIGYYMYKGGINKVGKYSLLTESKEVGNCNDCPAISYDFQAPVSEYGEIRESYGMLNLLHMFVSDFGEVLAPMENVMAKIEPEKDNFEDLRYAMRTDGKSGFVFVNHYQRLDKLNDIKSAVIDTGTVEFPPINVCGEISFILPFNLDLLGNNLEYATAQLLCKKGDTFFFAAVNGIETEYKFSDGAVYKAADGDITKHNNIKIVTLSFDRAKYMRKLSGEVYLGKLCDVYEAGGKICADGFESFEYDRWTGEGFEHTKAEREFKKAKIVLKDCKAPFEVPYPYELNIGGNREHSWKEIEVSGGEGFVEITEKFDVAQIYAEGELVADSFYFGLPWRLPAKLLSGKKCYMVMSNLRDDFYKEY